MVNLQLLSSITLLALGRRAFAESCSIHTYTTCPDGVYHWYDPDTGQICDLLDCGGGRAPPQSTVPGCPAYTGTQTRATSASFLPCWTGFAAPAAPTTDKAPVHTSTPTSPDAPTTTAPTQAAPASGTASTSPASPTTATASLSTKLAGNSTSTTSAVAKPTSNVGSFMTGSLVAVAVAGLGALVALL